MHRVIDWSFIEQLGRNIENGAEDNLPRARDLAAQAADMMTYAGQGGGLLVVLSFFFAAEYTEQAWETKRETAATLGQATRTIARNWEAVEDGNTGGLRIE